MKTPNRRQTLKLLAAAGAASVGLPAWSQDDYPSRVIRVIVPYPAGGTTDQLARAIAQPMSDMLGQPIIIENKPGAAGTIGADYVAKQPGDGYTLLFGNSGPNATASLMRKLPYDIRADFRPLSAVVRVPMILAVAADSPHRTVREFVEWARGQGDKLNYGSTGVGGSSHLTGEYFNEMAGTRFLHVPYAGGAPMVTAFASGQLHMAFVTGLDGASMVSAGKIRYLGVATPQRTEVLPGLQAIAEDVPGFSAIVWFGMLAPRGVPDPIVERLSQAITAAVRQPAVRDTFVRRNVEPWGSSPQELAQTIEAELAQWGPIVRKANIKI
jgi:tripartite-type tricarboxylate transporter receptor subunit TctC